MPAAKNAPRLAAVIGWPVAHSLSPLIHRTWAEREGAPAFYIPVAVEPGYDAFAEAAEALAGLGFKGANITLPHKENALRFAAEASDEASSAGAANMLTFREEGAYADNSDISGFAASVNEVLKKKDKRGRAIVLGAGGAARGVILALKRLGYSKIVIVNRTRARAEALAKEFGGEAAPWEEREDTLAGADLLVNTTSLGMKGEPALQLKLDALPDAAIVSDIVYAPLITPLLAAARNRGLRTADGLSMLMHQAVPGYMAWLGRKAAVDADLRARLEAAVEARGPR